MDKSPFFPDFLRSTVDEIAETALYLWERGWAERNSGNISVRVTGLLENGFQVSSPDMESSLAASFGELAGELFLVTGAGCRMRDVHNDPANNILLIRITPEGDRYEILAPFAGMPADLTPTSELVSHLMIHRYLKEHKPTRKVIVHAHPAGLIALSHSAIYKEEQTMNRLLWGMLPEAVIMVPEGIGVVPYRITGSIELARVSISSLRDHNVLLWEKHGCTAVASSPLEAFDLIDILDKSAEILFKCLHAGYSPEGLSDEQMNELRHRFHNS